MRKRVYSIFMAVANGEMEMFKNEHDFFFFR